jgi:hypothetical protein
MCESLKLIKQCIHFLKQLIKNIQKN